MDAMTPDNIRELAQHAARELDLDIPIMKAELTNDGETLTLHLLGGRTVEYPLASPDGQWIQRQPVPGSAALPGTPVPTPPTKTTKRARKPTQ